MRIHRNQPRLSMSPAAIAGIRRAYREGRRIEQKPVYRQGEWAPARSWNFVAFEYREVN
jgi:hypothetical protein